MPIALIAMFVGALIVVLVGTQGLARRIIGAQPVLRRRHRAVGLIGPALIVFGFFFLPAIFFIQRLL